MSDEDSYNDSQLKFWEVMQIFLKINNLVFFSIILIIIFICIIKREISMKDEKIKHLESKFEAALKDGAMIKTELAAAKSYILSLPTREELAKLKV